ncbi:hypothetical protein [Aquimarina aquimarini]|uniref:hypothetical protein n=1 Tax=Aquimarina aquimarini TaxID=1191734 RepID=UPI000D55968C|nr:hypothetical protein [Aquimarina aquimarini]
MTTSTTNTMDKKQLIKSVFIAFFIGLIVLITAVLPAEYNIDPLGTGKLFGFSKLYVNDTEEIEQTNTQSVSLLNFKKLKLEKLGSPASVPKPIEADNPAPSEQFTEKNDTIQVTVPAGKGIEYKFKALKYGSVKYEWSTTNDAIVYIDFHGEVLQENPPENVFYESYTLAYSNNMAGTFTAPFEGKHGWYFRNHNKEDITITIRLKGQYKLFDK